MWQPHARREDPLGSGARGTLRQLPTNDRMAASRPPLHREQLLKLHDELVCALGPDLSRIPSATRSTMRYLTYRHDEVSQSQARISETIGRVDREVIALEQAKSTAESLLEDKLLYGQLMGECVEVKDSLKTGVQTQDPVFIELKKEVQSTGEITELLQKQIKVLLDKLSSLKEIHAQLLTDYRVKDEAIKLTTKCLTHDLDSADSQLPGCEYKPGYVSYNTWRSSWKDMKRTADKLVEDSSSFRANLRFTLARRKNNHERQRHNTHRVMQKKINEMTKVQEGLRWERQIITDEMKDLTSDTCQVAGQIRNCDSKLHQTNQCLEILDRRPCRELCLDWPQVSLSLERTDLTKMAYGLRPVHKCCQQDMEALHRRLSSLEDRMAENAHAMKVEQRCIDLHHSFLPLHTNAIVLPDKARLCGVLGPSGRYSFLQ